MAFYKTATALEMTWKKCFIIKHWKQLPAAFQNRFTFYRYENAVHFSLETLRMKKKKSRNRRNEMIKKTPLIQWMCVLLIALCYFAWCIFFLSRLSFAPQNSGVRTEVTFVQKSIVNQKWNETNTKRNRCRTLSNKLCFSSCFSAGFTTTLWANLYFSFAYPWHLCNMKDLKRENNQPTELCSSEWCSFFILPSLSVLCCILFFFPFGMNLSCANDEFDGKISRKASNFWLQHTRILLTRCSVIVVLYIFIFFTNTTKPNRTAFQPFTLAHSSLQTHL